MPHSPLTSLRPRLRWLVIASLLTGGLAWAAPKVGGKVTVRVVSAKVMKAPKFIGATAGTSSRGEHYTVREIKGDWLRVDGPVPGWLHKSSIAEGAITLSSRPGDAGSTVSEDEVELAGRGFTPAVEADYKGKHPALDFSHVDAIERTGIDPSTLEAFVQNGKLEGETP